MAKTTSSTPSGVWLAFVGAVIIGTAIGMLTDNEAAWSLIGAGVGFLLVVGLRLSGHK